MKTFFGTLKSGAKHSTIADDAFRVAVNQLAMAANFLRLFSRLFNPTRTDDNRPAFATMFHIQKITSLDLPELAPYHTMRRSLEHEGQGIFVAEGEKVVRRLLASRFEVVSVLLPEKHLEDFRPLLDARPENLTVYLAERKLLEALIGFVFYQGVLAVGKIPPPAAQSHRRM